MSGRIRTWLRNYRHDLWLGRRQFVLLLVTMTLHCYVAFYQPGQTLLAVVPITGALLAGLAYLVYALPFATLRGIISMLAILMPFFPLMSALEDRLNLSGMVGFVLWIGLVMALVFLIARIPLRVWVGARRRVHASNAFVFDGEDFRAALFRHFLTGPALRSNDPMFIRVEPVPDKADTYLFVARTDAGPTYGDQEVHYVEVDAPRLMRTSVRVGKKEAKRLAVEQELTFDAIDPYTVEVTARQKANAGLLGVIQFYLGDTMGDWIDANVAWITGDEMRSAYGRSVNARVARAEARALRQGG